MVHLRPTFRIIMPGISSLLNSLANQVWSIGPGSRATLRGREVKLIAHRGAHGPGIAEENTAAAFAHCVTAGVWAVETDIRLTADGHPVIYHDPHCGRLHGRPELTIAHSTLDELRAAVPTLFTLAELVDDFAGKVHLMLEVKESWRERPVYPQRIMDCLTGLEPVRDFHLLSLVPDHLEGFPDLPRAACVDVAWMNTGRIIAENAALGHGGLAGSFALLGRRRLQRLHAAGRTVGTGFVTRPGALRREVYRGADWIFTDHALRLQTLINHEQKGDRRG
jgi:glycerophosphoryl diester phosphodiesterase